MKKGRWKVPAITSFPLEDIYWHDHGERENLLSHLIDSGLSKGKLVIDETTD
jgi:hypothetical protein